MKENFPNLAKEIDFQEVQEVQRVSKKLDPRRNTPRHIIITLPKIKEKERILEAAREKDIYGILKNKVKASNFVCLVVCFSFDFIFTTFYREQNDFVQ